MPTRGNACDAIKEIRDAFHRRRGHIPAEIAAPCHAATGKNKPQAEPRSLFEQNLGRVVVVAFGENVVMITDRRRAGQRQFGQPDPGRYAQRLFVQTRPVEIGHPRQPVVERAVDGDALEYRLEQMVMRVDQARSDDTARRVEHVLTGARRKITDLGDQAVFDPDGARKPRAEGVAGPAMCNPGDQHQRRSFGRDHGKNTRCAMLTA